jgi:hypothetical protein
MPAALTALRAACVAMLAFLPCRGHAMDMRVEGDTLFLSGGVVAADCDSFDRQLQAMNAIRMVVFEKSPGGEVNSGYCIGSHIRRHGLPTIIQAFCNSACSLMWLGGVERTLAGPGSSVGMHGMGNAVGTSDGSGGGELYQYISGMAPNVDHKLLDEWVHFKGLSLMMVFYQGRAELCRGKGLECTPIPGRNALNVGLATK